MVDVKEKLPSVPTTGSPTTSLPYLTVTVQPGSVCPDIVGFVVVCVAAVVIVSAGGVPSYVKVNVFDGLFLFPVASVNAPSLTLTS